MNSEEIEHYVRGAAALQGLTLSTEQLRGVAEVFARNAAIASLVLEIDLPESIEPAPVFKP
jgi:uncharacterized Zn finger protein